MRCAHGANRHSPRADRTHPADLRAGHGPAVGGCRDPSATRDGRCGGRRCISGPDPICPPGLGARRGRADWGPTPCGPATTSSGTAPASSPWLALTVAATATQRATLGTCVIQLPLRQAPAVAKQAATLQTLSQGRFILGVGVGSHPGEYERVGRRLPHQGPPARRRNRRAATVVGHRSGLTPPATPSAGGAGRYRQLPAPPTVPVWVGGSSEAALRRAATLADGWMPLFLSRRRVRARRSSGWPRRSTGPAGAAGCGHPFDGPVRLRRRRPRP